MGEFSLNLNATLSIGPRIITTLFLTETTYMEINSPGTSGEAELGKKKRSGSTGDQARRDPDSGNVIQTEMLMKSDRIKRCTYMYIALLFFRQLARMKTNVVNSGH